jgi:electron transfer flavoprotein beta subunit
VHHRAGGGPRLCVSAAGPLLGVIAVHILVCMKQVPDTTQVRINPETGTLMREGVPSIINPFDVHAIEQAVRVKEQYGGKITLICMGPAQAEEALKKGLSFGADRAILISDRAFMGSDTLATSYTLAEGLRQATEGDPADLVFAGKQTIDGDTAQVGPGIATRLGMSLFTYVINIREIDLEARSIVVERKVEGGREVLRGRLPALLTILKETNKPRYASLPNLMKALRSQVEHWNRAAFTNLDDAMLGLKGSPTRVNKIFAPPEREPGEIIPGGQENPDGAAAAVVEKIAASGILG